MTRKAKNTKISGYTLMFLIIFGTFTFLTSTLSTTGTVQGALVLTYPTDRWQRLWSNANGALLGETPDETNIQFNNNWAYGVLAYGLSDNIQFSSSRTINMPTSGTYTFKVGSDDGTKLWIDDTLVLNKWIDRGYTEDTATINLAAGNHRFRLDYYENAGSAQIAFSYTSPTGLLTYPTDRWQRLWSNANGALLGETPDETNIQFNNNWAYGVLAYGLSDNIQFSSSRTINMPTSGTYTFKVGSDDGTKLWIDDTLVLNKWIDRGYTEDTATINLAAGNHRFRLDYYENAGSAQIAFSYTSPTGLLTYPTDRWQRLWSNANGALLGETPDETNIQFNNNWAYGVLAYGLSDNIQFSSSRTINMPTSGTYTFKVGSDDGTKLWIDDTLVLNKWIDRGYTEDTATINLAAGNHRFRLDYYENAGSAQIAFSYTSPTGLLTYPTDRWQRLWSNANGALLGETPDETNIQFNNNWAYGVLAYGLSDNIQFSSSRTINMPTSGTYTFKVGSDDGTKLWIDDTLVLNKWIDRGYTEDTATINLAAGNHRFRLDYYENAGSAQIAFSYTSPTSTTSTAFKTGLSAWGLSGRLSDSIIQFMAKFDLVSTNYQITNIAALKAIHPDIIVLGYRDMCLMANNLPDWQTVNANEDWFYHYADGSRVVWYNVGGYGYNNYLMNPASVGWRNYFTSYTKAAITSAGMDGVSIDDVWSNWGMPIYGLNPPAFPVDYRTTCEAFITYVKAQFGSMLVLVNSPRNYDYPNACDGKYGENFLTMFDAFTDINALSTLSTAGKYYVAFSRNSEQQSMMYCLSGFLLGVNGPNAYFSQGDFFANGVGFEGWYPEFQTFQKLGQATGSYYFSQNVYMRDFSNGKVLFNPTANSYTVSLETKYIDPTTNQQFTQIQIPAWSGKIITRQ